MRTALDGVATPFGDLTFSLEVSADGKTARMTVEPLGDSCPKIVLHTGDWGTVDGQNIIKLESDRKNVIDIDLL